MASPRSPADRLAWPLGTERSKQYSGNVTATVGGITLNIDKDIVGGPLGPLWSRLGPPGPRGPRADPRGRARTRQRRRQRNR